MITKQLNLKNSMIRVDARFQKELKSIQEERLQIGTDSEVYGDKLSVRELTKLIIKHNAWPQIKKDLIEFGLEIENEQ